jgi:hypothetical protein
MLVQQAGKDAGMTSSTTLAFSSNNTAGNLIVVCVRASELNQVFSVTDTNGNQYRPARQYNVTLDGVTLAIFYAENVRGGANTVSIADSRLGTLRVAILEYAGVATANALDITAAAEGFGTTLDSGSAQTTVAGTLLVGTVTTASPASFSPGSGYALRASVPENNNAKLLVEDRVQGTAGSSAATGSLAVADAWGVILVAFKPAGM